MEIDDVLTKYREGDADQRLSLFLTYRELRDEFSHIDDETVVEQTSDKAYHGVKLVLRFIGL